VSVCRGKLRSVNKNKNNINKEVYCGSKNSTTKVAAVHSVLITHPTPASLSIGEANPWLTYWLVLV